MTARDPEVRPWTLPAALRAALAAFGVLVFFTWLDNYAYLFHSGPAPIQLVWIWVAAAGALVVIGARSPLPFLRSPVLFWSGLFFFVTTAWAMWTANSALALRANYRSIGYLAAFIVIFDDQRARRIGALAVIGAVLFAAGLNVAELFGAVALAGADMRVEGRAAGLYVNANDSGTAIVLGLAVALRFVPGAWRIPILVAGAAGVAATFSRGATLCLLALVPLLVWRKQVSAWAALAAGVAIVALLVTEGGSASRRLEQQGVLTEDTSARLALAQDDSGRVGLARDAWRAFLEAPLVGNGLGTTVQAHSQYLALAGDHGLLGLLLFPALAVALALANPASLPFALVLMVAGLFSHNLLEDRGSLLLVALAGARAPALLAARAPGLVVARAPDPARDPGAPAVS